LPCTIVGDIHGSIQDLIHILRKFPSYSDSACLLFLGDYVDRGPRSIDVIVLLLALVCCHPSRVFLLRGNHEFSHINRLYGFYDEIRTTYRSPELWDAFNTLFGFLPLAAVVGDTAFCVHGGLSPGLLSVDQLAGIELPIANYESDPMIADLVWSDPHDVVGGFATNHRGSGVLFGTDAVKAFLGAAGLRFLVRAHQCVADGFLAFAQNAGMTLFSSSEYCRLQHNKCGVLAMRGKGTVELFSLGDDWATARPKVKMAVNQGIGLRRIFEKRFANPRLATAKSPRAPLIAPKKSPRGPLSRIPVKPIKLQDCSDD
jgi:diadenosine tetraphosphatase ApaH/serine/threonine PP2A family protein phosphatase